jgi:N-acyl-D-aspartate/D-glutamate deacylase
MAEFDIVIKNGMIVDGARNPRYKGDVGIKDGVITRMGKIDPKRAARVIDAEGLVVAPGFVDLHTHYDAQAFWDPYLSTSGFHGVTSVVVGNCGFGFAPFKPAFRERAMMSMTRVEAIPYKTLKTALPWDWETFPEYLDSLDRTPKALNILPYVGLNPLLIWVLGLEDAKKGRKPTDAEHAEMARLLNEAMDAGACGWSAQCLGVPGDPTATTSGGSAQNDYDNTPMPTDVMWQETRLAMAKVLAERGEGFIELSMGLANPQLWEEIAEVSGAPIIWQAVTPNGANPEHRTKLLNWFTSCHEKGLRIYGQGITQDPPLVFTFDYYDLWGHGEWLKLMGPDVSREQKLANLKDPAAREALRNAPMKYMFIDGVPDTILHQTQTAEYKKFERKRVSEIAEALGKHPVDALLDIVLADELGTILQTRQFDTTLEGVKALIDNPYIIPGLSDGGAHLKYLTAGSYGTEYIAKYVREHKFTTLEEAHWRLSALPAFCAGFRDRGTLREGAAADIIVYDYDKLNFTYPEFVRDLPGDEYRVTNRGDGYRYVLVNGGVTIENDKPTNLYSGQLLRNGRVRNEAAAKLAAE